MNVRRKNVRLIKQKDTSDCAICCLAMLTGIRHRKVMSLVGDTYQAGKGMYNTPLALERLGFKTKKKKISGITGAYKLHEVDFKRMWKPYEISSGLFRDQVWGRRALLCVPSLNLKGGFHMVYWHYDRLLDPSTKKTYKHLDELQPEEIIIFSENV